MDMKSRLFSFSVLFCLSCMPLCAQQKPLPAKAAAPAVQKLGLPTIKVEKLPVRSTTDYSKESVVFEKVATTFYYNADGTGEKTAEIVARAQSDNGVHELGLIDLPYASGNEQLTFDYVKVRKPDGTVVETPVSDAQDMPAQVTRIAPLYSDLREVQLPVKSLSAGDTLDYKVHFTLKKAQAPNEFWNAVSFVTTNVVLNQTVELSFPKGKYVLVLSAKNKPVKTEESGRTVYRWTSAQLDPTSGRKQEMPDADALPDIVWTTFHNWQEVGDWYAGLAKGRSAVSPEIQAKADELTKGKTTDDEKIAAIYNYVSTQVRYIGVDFGIGRFQPHAAETVLDNQYGDCKDKHTLLAALLKAAGYDAWPALIGTTGKFHEEFPSPQQFNHVITFVSLPHRTIWLDSTPEVTPYEMLVATIRDREALVVPTDGAPELMKTPANGPFPFVDTYTGVGSLDSTGTLTGHISFDMRSDFGVAFREVFHNVPRAQWQQAAQNMSEAMGFGGTVSNLDVSLPERTDKPFVYSYDYTRKDYADWSNRRIVPLTMSVTLTSIGDDAPKKPIKLGSPRVEVHESTITLPPGYTAVVPQQAKYSTEFATYEEDNKLDGNKLITTRKLQILEREVPIAKADDYRKFQKNVEDNEGQYIQLVSATAAVKPDTTPSNPEAMELMQTAAADLTNHNLIDARANLDQAQQLNPKQPGLWGEYAYLEMLSNQLTTAITDLRKEVQYHPESTLAWRQIYVLQIRLKHLDDAAQTMRDELKALPGNPEAEALLGSVLILQKKYGDAAASYEMAVKQQPDNQNMRIEAARAELLAGNHDAGSASLHAALNKATEPEILNDAAYELADFNIDLPTAESSTKKALDKLDKETAQIALGNLTRNDIANVNLLSATWDTMGWVYFKEGKLPLAESYCRAAWDVSQHSEVGDHLGQIYEKEGNLKKAADMENLALAAATLSPDPSGTDAIQERLRGLLSHLKSYGSPDEELGKMRTFTVPDSATLDGSADFFVLLSPGKVEDVRFIRGDKQLSSATDLIKKVNFGSEFPEGAAGRLVRRGILYCSNVTKGCHITLLLPQSVTLQ